MAETVAAGTTTSGETPTLTLVDGSGNRTEGSSTDTLTRSSYTLYVTLDGETVQYTLTVTYTETYAVTFSAANAGVEDADGTDISSGTYAEEGEDFTFYVEASSGYELGDDAVTYSIDGGTSVTLSANSDGSYTIPGSEIQDITTGIAVTVTTAGSAASVELSLKDDVVADLEGSGDAYTLILPQGATAIGSGTDLETYLEATGSASDTDISNVASGVTSTGATLTFSSSTGGGQQVITLTIRSATDAETLAYDQALYTEALGERQNVTIDAANNSIDDVAGDLEDIIDGTATSPLFGSGETWGSTVKSVEVSTDDYTSWTPPSTNGAYTTLELPATITLSMGSEGPVEFQVTVTVRVTYQQA